MKIETSLREKRFKKKLKRKEFKRLNLKTFHKREQFFLKNVLGLQREYLPTPAPLCFSVIANREETIGYLNRVDKLLKSHSYTQMDFSKTEYTDLPSICLLSTYMLDNRTPGKYLEVKIPDTKSQARNIWEEVQFERMIVRDRMQEFNSGRFLSRTSKLINNKQIADILNTTVQHFGIEKRATLINLSAVINEIIENTTLHAAPGKTSKIPWIINTHAKEDGSKKEMEFCIVDLGAGVYETIKKNVHKWNTRRSRAAHRLSEILDDSQTQNYFLAKNIPKGVGSSTNKASRGKGIKYVYEESQNTFYKIFDIISNRAHIHLKDIRQVNNDSIHNFEGTIYYWKVAFDE